MTGMIELTNARYEGDEKIPIPYNDFFILRVADAGIGALLRHRSIAGYSYEVRETPTEINAKITAAQREAERREFAGKAMQGLLANPIYFDKLVKYEVTTTRIQSEAGKIIIDLAAALQSALDARDGMGMTPNQEEGKMNTIDLGEETSISIMIEIVGQALLTCNTANQKREVLRSFASHLCASTRRETIEEVAKIFDEKVAEQQQKIDSYTDNNPMDKMLRGFEKTFQSDCLGFAEEIRSLAVPTTR
jgi:hypothetical protein